MSTNRIKLGKNRLIEFSTEDEVVSRLADNIVADSNVGVACIARVHSETVDSEECSVVETKKKKKKERETIKSLEVINRLRPHHTRIYSHDNKLCKVGA